MEIPFRPGLELLLSGLHVTPEQLKLLTVLEKDLLLTSVRLVSAKTDVLVGNRSYKSLLVVEATWARTPARTQDVHVRLLQYGYDATEKPRMGEFTDGSALFVFDLDPSHRVQLDVYGAR